MKKIDVWVLVTWLALIGQIGSLIYSYDGNFALLETGFGLLQLMLIIAAALHVYVAFAVASNFDFIEGELNKLKILKNKNNSQAAVKEYKGGVYMGKLKERLKKLDDWIEER